MGAYDTMKRALISSGIYALGGSTAVDFELQAYAAGIDPAYDEVEAVQTESFLPTASGSGLESAERLLGLSPSGSAQQRQAAVCALLAVTSNSFTKTALEAEFAAFGLNVRLEENPAAQKIVIHFLKEPPCGRTQAQSLLEKICPAHLTAVSDFSTVS
jgi:uncharacterized protein YmfQ (DUF2313 family)